MKKALLFSSLLMCMFSTIAQKITRDASFGINGHGQYSPPSNSFSVDVKQLSDGKIINSGYTVNATSDMTIYKYLTNGEPDNTFGQQGKATIDLGGNDILLDVDVQSDGKLVICGSTVVSNNRRLAITRLHPNGLRDSSFGTNGAIVITSLLSSNLTDARYENVRIQTDGKIVVTGTALVNSTEYRGVIQRYQTNGKLDSSFASNGSRFVKFTTGNSNWCYNTFIQPNGQMLIAGEANQSGQASTYSQRIMRLNSNGSTDSSFATNGVSTGLVNHAPQWITELTDGKILALGYGKSGATYQAFTTRYSATGLLDSTYGTNGIARFAVTNGNNYAYEGYLASNDDLYFQTDSYLDTTRVAAILSINANGNLINSFGTNGIAQFEFDDLTGSYGLAAATNNEFLLAGESKNNTSQLFQGFVAKINSTGNVVSSFGTNGTAKAGYGKPSVTTKRIFAMNNGDLIVSGVINNPSKGAVLTKVDANGNTVSAFGRNGYATYNFDVDIEPYDVMLLPNQNMLLGTPSGIQTITVKSPGFPDFNMTGARYYSLCILNNNGAKQNCIGNFEVEKDRLPGVSEVIQDNNGKYITRVTSVYGGNSTRHFMIRHNANLTVDSSYGFNSRYQLEQGGVPIQMIIAPDNDVVVLYASVSGGDFVVAKYNEDKNLFLDNNFGLSGSPGRFESTQNEVARKFWKFNNGYYVNYYLNGFSHIMHLGFNGTPSTFGDVTVDSIPSTSLFTTDMKQLADSSFIITHVQNSDIKVFHYFANGMPDTSFNNTSELTNLGITSKHRVQRVLINNDTSIVLFHQFLEGNTPSVLGITKLILNTIATDTNTNDTTVGLQPFESNTIATNIYPNPFNTSFSFTLENIQKNASETSIKLFDLMGKEVPIKTQTIGNNVEITPTEALTNGIYLLKLEHNNKHGYYKLLKN